MNLYKKTITFSLILLFQIHCHAQVLHWLSQPESAAGALINRGIIDGKISANGRYVSFRGAATNLVTGDTNGLMDLFVKDLQTGQTTLVSTNSNNQLLTDYSVSAYSAPTSDGQWVAFTSWSAQLPGGVGFADEYLYLKNLNTGAVINHSDMGGGEFLEIQSDDVFLSDDAQYITFGSVNFNDPNFYFRTQVFRKQLSTGSLELISVATDGMTGSNDTVRLGDVSDNGRYMVFSAGADNLVADVINNSGDNVYLRDTQNGTTTLINRTPNGDTSSYSDTFLNNMSVSNTGQVAFTTRQDDLVAADTNNSIDLFLFDNGSLNRINLSPNGDQLNDALPTRPVINGNGDVILFNDRSVGLSAIIDNNNYFNLYKYDLSTEVISLVTIGTNGDAANFESFTQADMTTSGNRAVFNSGATNLVNTPVAAQHDSLYATNLNNGLITMISDAAFDPMTTDNGSYHPQISSDQMTVVYASDATNLTTELISPQRNLYLLNRATNSHEIIGRKAFTIADISPSGRYVVFASEYFQPAGEIDLGSYYLFLLDRQTGVYTQIEEAQFGKVNNNGLVVFETDKSLDANDLNGVADVYVFTPDTQSIELLSKNASGAAVNGFDPDIAGPANNTWITFTSNSAELVNNDNNDLFDVFLKKWPNGPFIRASATVAGVEGDGNSVQPRISTNTDFVVFISKAQNLTSDDYTAADQDQLIMYDRINQTHHLVTKNDEGLPIYDDNPQIFFYDISDSGRYVAYEYTDGGEFGDLDFAGDDDGRKDVIMYDHDNETSQVISKYLNGINSNDPSERPKVVEDLSQSPPLVGVVFESQGGDLTGRSDHPGLFDEIILYQQGGDDVTLSIVVDGPGTVTGNAGINCATLCDQDFSLGTSLDLVASPDVGMFFIGWEVDFGSCQDDTNPCNLIMDRSKTLTARFMDTSDLIFQAGFEWRCV